MAEVTGSLPILVDADAGIFIFLEYHHCFVLPPIYKNAFTP